MIKYLIIFLLTFPLLSKSQSILAKRYVDDRINEDTHLFFKQDSTFEFKYLYDLMGDMAVGRYTRRKDTLFLTYAKDTISGITFFANGIGIRADSLIIKGKKLYKIENGKSREYLPQEITYKKPPKSWHYKRKYVFLGPWRSNYSRYYMVDEKFAKWATKKWLKEHKDLFQ